MGSASAATLVRQPYVQNVRKQGATIQWTTGEPGEASVITTDPAGREQLFSCVSVPRPASLTGQAKNYWRHRAVLSGLTSGTDYSYRVLLDGVSLPTAADLGFRTVGVNTFGFVALGDTGVGSEEQRQLAALVQTERARFVIHTGDIAYPDGNYEAYEKRYFDFYQATMSRVPFFPCPGNHDYFEAGVEAYLSIHDVPADGVPARDQGRYYSFDWADAHVVSLDSNACLDEAARGQGAMLEWLDRDLSQSRAYWRIVFFHHPPFAVGVHSQERLTVLARERIVPILEQYSVPLVLCGHEHSYQRSQALRGGSPNPGGAVYITTGGGGATLYDVPDTPVNAAARSAYHYVRCEVDGRQIRLQAIGINGREFDAAFIAPPPAIAQRGVTNAASYTSRIGRGGLITIFGWHFSIDTRSASGQPLGDDVDVRVTIGDDRLPLLMVSPTQINALLPEQWIGPVRLKVITPLGTAETNMEILPLAPAIFGDGLFHGDGNAITPDLPATAGGLVDVFVTGIGASQQPVLVRVGAQGVWVAPQAMEGVPGIQRLRFALPDGLATGTVPLMVEAGGVSSNTLGLPVLG